ncbi:MAG TPA: hybrid sensor histidine kinase/response regulator [Methanospirillum sp.]|nr:hybrid sensor histidine kinase/response regulator [Methanospirillum sp.]
MKPDVRSPHTISILIVEDSKTQATMLQHLLESAGYMVRVAYNGEDALVAVEHEQPTLVLTDIVMPGMNGYELCRAIKKNPETAGTPVILVTQLFDPHDVVEGLECGADNFIIKPYEGQYLLSRIEVILANRYLQQNEMMQIGIEIFFAGRKHFITSNRLQILNILLSTYEIAIQKNNELIETKDRLAALNDQLSEANEYLNQSNDELGREIAERKRIEGALSEANKKLNLLSSITRHDMKNILMAILAYHELADMDSTDSEFRKYLAREKDLLSKMTNQIEFTRLYESLGTYLAVWKSPYSIVQDISREFPQFTVNMDESIANYEIFADPLIEKVFYNLFDNSARHGGTASVITVAAKVTETDLQIMISDNGIGISEEDKPKIFRRGFGKNTGLGLFLVREILSITNISITESGKEGEGVCFTLIVPNSDYRKIAA